MAYLMSWSIYLKGQSPWFPCPAQASVHHGFACSPSLLDRRGQRNAIIIRFQIYYSFPPLNNSIATLSRQTESHMWLFSCLLVFWCEEPRVIISIYRLMFNRPPSNEISAGDSVVAVQWLGLTALTAEGPGSIPNQGTKIPQAVQCGYTKKKELISVQLYKLYTFYRVFLGNSDRKESSCNAGDAGLIPVTSRSLGEGNDYPLQYSCLENSMDRGTSWTIVHEVSQNQTRVSD